MDRRIVCAANRNAATGMIILGARHFDSIMQQQMAARPTEEQDDWRKSEHGFIDQNGKFLTRDEAWLVASHAEQILRRVGGDDHTLYSENLY